MIAQFFMVFFLKVDANLNMTEESLSEHYSKASWASIGLLIALTPLWTVNSSSQSRTAAAGENCS